MGLFGKPDPRPAQEPAVPPSAPAAPRPSTKNTVMGEKTRYVGKIDTDEALLVLGRVDGEIKSSSEVEIGETGEVKATISARSIVISGKVTGECTASERLEIRPSGRLNGTIKAPRIAIAEGAEFKGTSQMSANPRA